MVWRKAAAQAPEPETHGFGADTTGRQQGDQPAHELDHDRVVAGQERGLDEPQDLVEVLP